MLPPSLRTGAWRTHHHRVATTPDLPGLDIARTLQYCSMWLYVRDRTVSSDISNSVWRHARKSKDTREILMGRLEGKSVIITGAGSGIGRAASLLFAKEGARLVIVDRSESVKGVSYTHLRAHETRHD